MLCCVIGQRTDHHHLYHPEEANRETEGMWFTGYPFGDTGWGVPNRATSPGIFGWFRTCDSWWSYSDLGAIARINVSSDYHHVNRKPVLIFGASWFYDEKSGMYGTFDVSDDHAWFDLGAPHLTTEEADLTKNNKNINYPLI